jgi:hypothetical protein
MILDIFIFRSQTLTLAAMQIRSSGAVRRAASTLSSKMR